MTPDCARPSLYNYMTDRFMAVLPAGLIPDVLLWFLLLVGWLAGDDDDDALVAACFGKDH